MKKLLISFLILSFLIELFITGKALLDPSGAMKLFNVADSADVRYLVNLSGWFCLLISSFCLYAIICLIRSRPGASAVIYILGIWWVALGFGIYFASGRSTNLLLDSAKGAILAVLNFLKSRRRIDNR